MMEKWIQDPMDELIQRYPSLDVCRDDVKKAVLLMADCFAGGGKLLTCGNGGSASDAQHIVGELMKGFVLPRKLTGEICDRLNDPYLSDHLQGALPAISLVGEAALSTAFANDCEPELAFAQQVLGLGRTGDVLLGLSTSGNSKNVFYAAKVAKARGMKVIMLTGVGGGMCAALADAAICVPAAETYKVQEYHLPVYHAICLMLEEKFFGRAV